MQFVDDELVPRREMEIVPLPVEARVVDDGVADRAGHLAGIRVDALELALRRGQQVPVLIADTSLGNVSVPVAVLLGLHGMIVAVPVVERSDDGNPLGIGRPHAEPDSPCMRNGSHALDFRFTAHVGLLTTREGVSRITAASRRRTPCLQDQLCEDDRRKRYRYGYSLRQGESDGKNSFLAVDGRFDTHQNSFLF